MVDVRGGDGCGRTTGSEVFGMHRRPIVTDEHVAPLAPAALMAAIDDFIEGVTDATTRKAFKPNV